MTIDFEKTKDITLGAARVECDKSGFNFYRFTEEQEELYKNRQEKFYSNTFSTSGVCLAFRTNSENLYLSALVTKSSSQNYLAFDVLVNGEKIDSLTNFDDLDFDKSHGYNELDIFPFGDFRKTFSLGKGEKEVRVYLPWAQRAIIKELSLDDGATLVPVKPKYKMLCFGDSITQGYHALYPSSKYVTRLARFLDAEEHNKAIGGEVFFPELANTKEDFVPDIITVAYGTNDWSKTEKDEFIENCKAFFDNLSTNYPTSKIYAITPIWRKDYTEYRPFGEFCDVAKLIKELTAKHSNIKVISGFDFIEHEEKWFCDKRLHPNDEGFLRYFKSLSEQIRL